MLQDHESSERRVVSQTIGFQPDPPSGGRRARTRHVLVAASSDETRVELYGSGHVLQPANYRMIRKGGRKVHNVSRVTMRAGVRGVVRE